MTDTTPRAIALIDDLIAALAQSHMTIAALVAETHKLRRDLAAIHEQLVEAGGIR